jgi:ketosteroid isomerase-like protein
MKLKEGYDAFNQRDFAKLGENYTENTVWHFVAGDVKGKEAVIAYAKDQIARFDATIDPHDVLASDDHLVALLSYTVKGNPYKLVHILHTDEQGKTTEAWSFGEPDLAKVVLQR